MVILLMVIYVKNKYWIIILLIFVAIGIAAYFFINNIKQETQEYSVDKTEATVNSVQENTISNQNEQDTETENSPQPPPPQIETEISSFTTKIYSKDSGRQNNIKITCSTLNDTYVENGETFSFCGTVGQATTAKGYQKAEIFDNKRKC